ncbi:nucleoside diphosphate-linked moiety X motif 17 [Dicentrarchus labrax]|uniref:nucleoside diphosphate-linked moiety X motif 17 n=1 Tax=Dicentrarchus labrax TaxID=13489 RepID=UPI0021F532DB|nr:nucleoside diphosphate-linked moiety X motif 17 [Dicentrarchus labrax]XP_051255333.1 nucleoside diphosphate-linked moiety X motif 17 [Dicentrarchus labrax]XP_051255334.1 nucleoside diphosphate-linked moiety X motif 17 [Dicentrarchus labrax]XP_051255335.1 nucleoside diphosphate-linked moiety X motif 17 [Dicentrarchus labrax]XP_051255336.1 nucleoside diphosphate-linked moiety X motif 17 [Dicentrarchus labrax]XP_051255337.1 nucleoside diphosphate-linked moiety X motif 17 [Dicentrarchus labrax]
MMMMKTTVRNIDSDDDDDDDEDHCEEPVVTPAVVDEQGQSPSCLQAGPGAVPVGSNRLEAGNGDDGVRYLLLLSSSSAPPQLLQYGGSLSSQDARGPQGDHLIIIAGENNATPRRHGDQRKNKKCSKTPKKYLGNMNKVRRQYGQGEEDPGVCLQGASCSSASSVCPAPHCNCWQSVTGQFSDGGADEVEVNCSLEKNQFILYRGDKERGVPLKRPAFCPIKHLSVTEAAAIPLDVQQRGIDVGVAIILQTANQRVLLTRRAKELRIFPNVWVPPGGHVEPDETLLGAGLRELMEETGLKLEPEEVSPKILGLWESVYPPMLSRGLPQRHHIVVYMLLHSSRSHLQLQSSLSPSPAEVSACLWADRRLVGAIVSAVDGEDTAVGLDDLPSSIRYDRLQFPAWC